MRTIDLEYSLHTMREAIRDVSYLLTEIDAMDSAGSQEVTIAQSLARCAYARLQQIERDCNE